jgi:hypothetical protein
MRRIYLALVLSCALFGQTTPEPLMVTRQANITTTPSTCTAGSSQCIDNRSSQRRNDYHSMSCTGSGTWSAVLEYSTTGTGSWTSFGAAATVNQASNPAIAYGNGYQAFIRVNITGTATCQYAASKQYYLSTSVGATEFPLSVAQGGTNATTAAAARASLETAASGANSDITSLSGLTTPLSVPQGGTGAATLTGIVKGNGTSAMGAVAASSDGQFLRRKHNQTSVDYEFATRDYVVGSDYDWTSSQSQTITVPGSYTFTVTPCPLGVAGANTNYWIYLTGGVGTAENGKVTGGTCTSGASTGTLIVTLANAHSGSYTIGSNSSGLAEAGRAVSWTKAIRYPGGSYNIYGPVTMPTEAVVEGAGVNNTVFTSSYTAGPAITVADADGSGSGGLGWFRGFALVGPGAASASSVGIWFGRDPAGVIVPDTWSGSYFRTYDIGVRSFGNALYIQRANFLRFVNSYFSQSVNSVYIPTDIETGEGIEFDGCVVASSTNGFNLNAYYAPVVFNKGSIDYNTANGVTGTGVWFTSYGTFWETLSGTHIGITAAGTHTINIHGGYMVYNPLAGTITNMIAMTGGGYYRAAIKNVHMQVPTGVTITNLININSIASGVLEVDGNIGLDAGGTVTNRVVVAGTSNVRVHWPQQTTSGVIPVAAGATTTFPSLAAGGDYPYFIPTIAITGATVGGSGITAVAGLTAGHRGTFYTANAQTFTAGVTIGNTITTVAFHPYTFWFDGTQVWIK